MSPGEEDWTTLAAPILRVLADLSSSRERDEAPAGSIPLDWFHWLPASAAWMVSPVWHARPPGQSTAERFLWQASGQDPFATDAVPLDPAIGERLAAVDQLRTVSGALRVGWLFVAGRTTDTEGRVRRIFHPLVSRTVEVQRSVSALPRSWGLVPTGDTVLSPFITDGATRGWLEHRIEYGGGALSGSDVGIAPALLARLTRLARFARETSTAAGLPADVVVPAGPPPSALMDHDGLVIVAGLAVYAVTDGSAGTGASGSLRAWSDAATGPTAFHSLYLPERVPVDADRHDDVDHDTADDGDPVRSLGSPVSPFPLTPAQRRAVRSSRRLPVTVVSGAPGTGKSHTITAIACDALARGQTVLVAAKSDATVDALTELFERAPGPQPPVFGSSRRRDALAEELAAGQPRIVGEAEVEAALDRLRRAVAERDTCHAVITAKLDAERIADAPPPTLGSARARWPWLFDPTTDLHAIGARLAVAAHGGGGWLDRRRHRRAVADLDEQAGVHDAAGRQEFAAAYRLAETARAAALLVDVGGLDLGARWEELATLDEEVRLASAHWLALEAHRHDRMSPSALGAVAALATALRSGRAARRELLARVSPALTRALPLWVGTLSDIEDLLPRRPGEFDLVVLDEASSIDQPLAAPALLRGRRAVIVGDPRQLRHVSFLADDRRDDALRAAGIGVRSQLAAKLDVRRNSTFDLGAGVSPVIVLDEHFRGSPHLVDFVARRLYRGDLHVAMRTPATASLDCIDVVRVEGSRDRHGVVTAEVTEVVRRLRHLRSTGATDVGVVTPFRAQAEGLEAAVLKAFDADDLEAMDLRVGTAHGFQGIERDVVLISLGVGAGGVKAWPFVEDPHLFTVLVTRARRQVVVVLAGDPPADGLVADYLGQADAPPGPPRAVGGPSPWIDDLADDLRAAGVPTVAGYPAGGHVVDLCLGDEWSFCGVIGTVHPDGAIAHVDRQLALRRAGWPLRDAFPSRWADRRGELLVELGLAVRRHGAG